MHPLNDTEAARLLESWLFCAQFDRDDGTMMLPALHVDVVRATQELSPLAAAATIRLAASLSWACQ
jgi:hypothetical protein